MNDDDCFDDGDDSLSDQSTTVTHRHTAGGDRAHTLTSAMHNAQRADDLQHEQTRQQLAAELQLQQEIHAAETLLAKEEETNAAMEREIAGLNEEADRLEVERAQHVSNAKAARELYERKIKDEEDLTTALDAEIASMDRRMEEKGKQVHRKLWERHTRESRYQQRQRGEPELVHDEAWVEPEADMSIPEVRELTFRFLDRRLRYISEIDDIHNRHHQEVEALRQKRIKDLHAECDERERRVQQRAAQHAAVQAEEVDPVYDVDETIPLDASRAEEVELRFQHFVRREARKLVRAIDDHLCLTCAGVDDLLGDRQLPDWAERVYARLEAELDVAEEGEREEVKQAETEQTGEASEEKEEREAEEEKGDEEGCG